MQASFDQTFKEALKIMQENHDMIDYIVNERNQLIANLKELKYRLQHEDIEPSVREKVIAHINKAYETLGAIDARLKQVRKTYQKMSQLKSSA